MRKTKLINNPLKQRQHDLSDMNFNSQGVVQTIHFTQKDRRLWDIGIKVLQQDRHFDMFNSPLKTQNLDNFKLKDGDFSTEKEKQLKDCSFVDKTQQQRNKRSSTICQQIEDNRRILAAKIGTQPSGDKCNYQDKQIINLPATTTTYRTFMENPIEQEKKKTTMRPDFYQSAVPKYLNIGYRIMAQGFEQQNYLYQKPAIIRPRIYSCEDDFKKNFLMTNKKWQPQLRSQKDYI